VEKGFISPQGQTLIAQAETKVIKIAIVEAEKA
jgi:hypothetical protein